MRIKVYLDKGFTSFRIFNVLDTLSKKQVIKIVNKTFGKKNWYYVENQDYYKKPSTFEK